MNFIIKNLYKSNPDATVKPKEKVDGKYTTDFFNMVKIATPINTLKNKSESSQTAELSWLAAVDANEVKVEQSTDNGTTWSVAKTVQPVTVNSNLAVVTGLKANTSYKFKVKVTGGLNNGISNVVTTEVAPVKSK